MAISIKELRRRGCSDKDIKTAKMIQRRQREQAMSGIDCPVQTLGEICGFGKPEPTAPADLTARQLRRRGRIGQAALLLDQEALDTKDLVRQTHLRKLSFEAKELAERHQQLEFDFFKGNWSVADQYHDTIRDRIHALPISAPKRTMAITVMAEIIRWIPWEEAACSKTAVEIADLLKVNVSDVSRAIKILEEVGAIHRVQRGRTKLIYVNPEGAYRGRVANHAEVVGKFKAEVIDLNAEREKRP
jgi:DNA-binding transcriptional ArsR family regulator